MIDRNDYEPKPRSIEQDSHESFKRGDVVTSSSLIVIQSTTTVRYRRRYFNFIGSEIRFHNTEEWRLKICVTEDWGKNSDKTII